MRNLVVVCSFLRSPPQSSILFSPHTPLWKKKRAERKRLEMQWGPPNGYASPVYGRAPAMERHYSETNLTLWVMLFSGLGAVVAMLLLVGLVNCIEKRREREHAAEVKMELMRTKHLTGGVVGGRGSKAKRYCRYSGDERTVLKSPIFSARSSAFDSGQESGGEDTEDHIETRLPSEIVTLKRERTLTILNQLRPQIAAVRPEAKDDEAGDDLSKTLRRKSGSRNIAPTPHDVKSLPTGKKA